VLHLATSYANVMFNFKYPPLQNRRRSFWQSCVLQFGIKSCSTDKTQQESSIFTCIVGRGTN